MDGWMDGWMDVKAILRFAYSKQQDRLKPVSETTVRVILYCGFCGYYFSYGYFSN
jgi:hypothetical protein